MAWLRIMHPYFLLVTFLWLVQGIAGVLIVILGVWRLFRGSDQLKTTAWILLGTAPFWVYAAFATYGFWKKGTFVGRDTFGAPAGAVLVDVMKRFRFPHRVEGRKNLMWTDGEENAEQEVAVMDRHIERLEKVLGRTCDAKVHWIRGGLWRFHGRYLQGIFFGTTAEATPNEPVELHHLDEHEVAHFVIHHLCKPDADPPALLVEGWTVAQETRNPGFLANRNLEVEEKRSCALTRGTH